MHSAAGPHLDDHLETIRRSWPLAAVGVAAGVLVAVVALAVLPRSYVATTAVHVEPSGVAALTGEGAGRTPGEVNLDTEAQVVASAVVAADVAEAVEDSPDTAELRENVDVTVPPNSSVLEISYSGSTPAQARDVAAAFADSYLAYRSERIEERIEDRLAGIQRELETKYEELDELTGHAAGAEGMAAAQADTRVEVVRDEVADLNSERTPLAAVRGSGPSGVILTPATEPESAASPVPLLWLTGGALAGLAAGTAAAAAAERFARRSRPLPSQNGHAARQENTASLAESPVTAASTAEQHR